MKVTPIIMSGPMIRVLLEGRKTQTRRIMKPAFGKKHPLVELKDHGLDDLEEYSGKHNDPLSWGYPGAEDGADISIGRWGSTLSPYLHLDKDLNWQLNLLWVRETFCQVDDRESGGELWIDYRATPRHEESHPAGWENAPDDAEALKWKPSIFMPRRHSRLTLELTAVRAERLNDINEEDALAEGISEDKNAGYKRFHVEGLPHPNKDFPELSRTNAREMYAALWDCLHGSGQWLSNPWVWVLSFTVHQQNIDAFLKAREVAA